jgi:hypothetical protein
VSQEAWSAKLGVDLTGSPEQHVTLLVEALHGLERLAEEQPKTRAVGLIIDEFQRVIELGGAQAEAQIRAAIQRHSRVGYVFAGSKTRMLTAMTMDAARPFYRLGSVRFIGPVPAEDFERFLTEKFVESGFKVADSSAVRAILDLAEQVPYNVQMLAHTCWNELRDRASKRAAVLDESVVTAAMELLVRQYDPFYTQIWADLTPIQQKTLVAVIREQGVNLQSMKVTQFVGKGASTVQRALESFTERNILREDQSEGGVRMRFEDPFLARWIMAFPGRVFEIFPGGTLEPVS